MTDQANLFLLDALENERRHTAKELHDGVAQTTLQLGLQIGICRKLLGLNQLDTLTNELAQLEERIQVVSRQVRELVQDLRPPIIDLESPDLQAYIEYIVSVHQHRGGVPVTLQFKALDEVELLPSHMLGLARIVQEGLLNVRKHAQATHVHLILGVESETLYLMLADDGQGVDLAEDEAKPMAAGGVGLQNLQMRTQAMGGMLTVSPGPTGTGTKIMVMLPKHS